MRLDNGGKLKSYAAGGATLASLVELSDVSLFCSDDETDFKVPATLHAVVTDFPQEHLDPAHDPVEGMLGMENKMRQYDLPAWTF